MEMAKAKNAQPLPVLKLSSGPGVRLPPDRFCLTQPNYRLKLNSDATVSSTSNTGRSWVTGLKLPGTPKGFKTPSGVAPRSISSVSSSSSAGSSPCNYFHHLWLNDIIFISDWFGWNLICYIFFVQSDYNFLVLTYSISAYSFLRKRATRWEWIANDHTRSQFPSGSVKQQ